jgi:hypothetical protein
MTDTKTLASTIEAVQYLATGLDMLPSAAWDLVKLAGTTSHDFTHKGVSYTLAPVPAPGYTLTTHGPASPIPSMIAWIDAHWADSMDPGIAAAIAAEDPRTWAEVYAAGLVTDQDVISKWLELQALAALPS